MKDKKYAYIFGLFLSIAILLSPFAIWQVWLGEPIYDSVFKESLSSLPIQRGGRIMPLSSASADVLRQISGKVTGKDSSGKKISATHWIWNLASDNTESSLAKVFKTDNKDLQKLLKADGRYYSQSQLLSYYDKIYETATEQNNIFAKACATALESALTYALASNAFIPRLVPADSAEESLKLWNESVIEARNEFILSKKENREPNQEKLIGASSNLKCLKDASDFENENTDSILRVIPSKNGGFTTPSQVALDSECGDNAKKILLLYSQLRDAIAKKDFEVANQKLKEVSEALDRVNGVDFFRVKLENFMNAFDPFFSGFILYGFSILIFLLGTLFKRFSKSFISVGTVMLALGVAIHILAFCVRMYIQQRPPVTNMYSSIVFTGGIASAIGLLGFIKNNRIQFAFSASVIGFISLLVAMNLSYSGDTMGMMRAVLNSNFWLTMHVVTIMVGYCGILLGGGLAACRLISNLFDKGDFGFATGETATSVYGVLCFALLFTFAGTMLGGIWADMSWGRFWGWDPKENGALMTVLWTAMAIHAKAFRICSDRIFLGLAVLGNIVLAWAWFGVNLLGIGLHSYGFTEGGWLWFFIFVLANLIITPIAFYKYKPRK